MFKQNLIVLYIKRKINLNRICNLFNHLVVDPNFESGGATVHKLNEPLGIAGGDDHIHIFGKDLTMVAHAAGLVLAMTWIVSHHLINQKNMLINGITS